MGARTRLIIVWVLFAAWVTWLGWQSLRHARFPVVSRAQLLETRWIIVADLTADNEGRALSACTVVEALRTDGAEPAPDPGSTINVVNLPGRAGFVGAGRYVLPLSNLNPSKLAGFPRSPLIDPGRFPPQIYRDSPAVRAQILEFYQGR